MISTVFDEATRRAPQHRRPQVVWKAARCFFRQGDRGAEDWVAVHAPRILSGNSQQVAVAVRAQATRSRLLPDERWYLTVQYPSATMRSSVLCRLVRNRWWRIHQTGGRGDDSDDHDA